MRAEFFRADAPDRVVGEAEWDGRRVVIHAEDDEARAALERVFRPAPVAVPYRGPPGPEGDSAVEPGDMQWFRAAATVRGGEEGLAVRFVTEVAGRWDPALEPHIYGWGGRKPALPR
jgi:hypothetical protein